MARKRRTPKPQPEEPEVPGSAPAEEAPASKPVQGDKIPLRSQNSASFRTQVLAFPQCLHLRP